jgi:hypothetical protein
LIDAVSKIVLAFVMGALYEDKSMALELSANISAEPDPARLDLTPKAPRVGAYWLCNGPHRTLRPSIIPATN